MSATKTLIRHVDKGVLLGSFATEALAVCPKCNGPAIVSCESDYAVPFVPLHPRIHCLKCSFNRTESEARWLGPAIGVAKERCPNCGFKWLESRHRCKEIRSRVRKWASVSCPECKTRTNLEIVWHVDRIGNPTDPAFGLPLLVAIAVLRGDTLGLQRNSPPGGS